MSDDQMLYCLISFILGWIISRMMGDGFIVGGVEEIEDPTSNQLEVYIGTPSDILDKWLDHYIRGGRRKNLKNLQNSDEAKYWYRIWAQTNMAPPQCNNNDGVDYKKCCRGKDSWPDISIHDYGGSSYINGGRIKCNPSKKCVWGADRE